MVSVFQKETKMGTYTTNYNLFMPSVGEQGWGELVNGNFTTIDTTMARLNTRIGTLETETDTLDSRIEALEITIPEQGLVDGNLKGLLFVPAVIQISEGNEIYAQCPTQTSRGTSTTNPTNITIANYTYPYVTPKRHTVGVFTRESDLSGIPALNLTTRTMQISCLVGGTITGYYKKTTDSTYTSVTLTQSKPANVTVEVGSTYSYYAKYSNGNNAYDQILTVLAEPTYYVKYATP